MDLPVHIEDGKDLAEVYKGKSVIDICHDQVCDCLRSILGKLQPLDKEDPITIADYGTADGSIVIPILNNAIRMIRNRFGKEKEIMIVFEDQPSNDFNALSRTINGQKNSLDSDENVFALASTTNMFKQCMPVESVDMIISTMALQWLSKSPCAIKDGIFIVDADDEEYTSYKRQSAIDLKTFLTQRGKELKKGGRMVLGIMSKMPDGKVTEPVYGGYSSLSAVLKRLLKKGIITEHELCNITCVADYERTEQDIREPFNSGEITRHLSLIIESLRFNELVIVPGLHEDECKDQDRVKAYVQNVVNGVKIWLYSTIMSGLEERRSEPERCFITEEYFKELYDFVLSSKKYPNVTYRTAVLVVMKNKSKDRF